MSSIQTRYFIILIILLISYGVVVRLMLLGSEIVRISWFIFARILWFLWFIFWCIFFSGTLSLSNFTFFSFIVGYCGSLGLVKGTLTNTLWNKYFIHINYDWGDWIPSHKVL